MQHNANEDRHWADHNPATRKPAGKLSDAKHITGGHGHHTPIGAPRRVECFRKQQEESTAAVGSQPNHLLTLHDCHSTPVTPLGTAFSPARGGTDVLSKTLVQDAVASGRYCRGRPRLVASMTTFPSRMRDVSKVVYSLTRQSCLPDIIYIFVSTVPRITRLNATGHRQLVGTPDADIVSQCDREIDAIMPRVTELLAEPLVRIRIITDPEDDFGPATKLLAPLQLEPDKRTFIVTVDDDNVYHAHAFLALTLVAQHMRRPAAVGFVCQQYNRTAPQHLLGTITNHFDNVHEEGECHGWFYGVNAVLYPRGAFGGRQSDLVYDFAQAGEATTACQLNDDVWFASHLINRGTAPFIIRPGFRPSDCSTFRCNAIENRPNYSSFMIQHRLGLHASLMNKCASAFCAM